MHTDHSLNLLDLRRQDLHHRAATHRASRPAPRTLPDQASSSPAADARLRLATRVRLALIGTVRRDRSDRPDAARPEAARPLTARPTC